MDLVAVALYGTVRDASGYDDVTSVALCRSRRSRARARMCESLMYIGLTPAEKEVLDSVNSWLKLGVSPAGLTPV